MIWGYISKYVRFEGYIYIFLKKS